MIWIVIGILWIVMDLIYNYKGEIRIAPIKGLMIGALYNNEKINELDTEHIVQVLFFVFSLNFIWLTQK